jgi:hypothetical protein
MELVEWRVLQRTSLMELHCSEATVLQVLFMKLAHSVALQLNRTGWLSGSSSTQMSWLSFLSAFFNLYRQRQPLCTY